VAERKNNKDSRQKVRLSGRSNSSFSLPLFSRSEITSLFDQCYYEKTASEDGFHLIAGVDEAGRGPLAGPVVAAAVIIPIGSALEGITDSKRLSAAKREEAFRLINRKAVAVGIGVVSQRRIDEINILRASLEAMKRAVLSLDTKPDFVLVDGNQPIPFSIPQRCVIGGDRKCLSISAASVMAKVYRDRIMGTFDQYYPQYGFCRNKGYGTDGHRRALRIHGPSPVHRLSFRGVKI